MKLTWQSNIAFAEQMIHYNLKCIPLQSGLQKNVETNAITLARFAGGTVCYTGISFPFPYIN